MSCKYCVKKEDGSLFGEELIDLESIDEFVIGGDPIFSVYSALHSDTSDYEQKDPAILFDISNDFTDCSIYTRRVPISYCPFCGEKLI